jgi:transposase-like protein
MECQDMPTAKRTLSKKTPKKPPQAAAVEDTEAIVDHDKSKVECLCPKCGKKHIMNFHWIGRGTPRKYCQSCRDSI